MLKSALTGKTDQPEALVQPPQGPVNQNQPTHSTELKTPSLSNQPKNQPTPPTQTQNNQPKNQNTPQVDPKDLAQKLPQSIQEELIVDWVAPSRPYKKRSRQFFSTMWAIALLVAVILIFANQIIFAMVVGALAFMAHLLFKIPPGNIYYAVTTFGIRIGEELYFWEELNHFWFDTKYGQRVLMIDTVRFPHRLTLVIYPEDEEILRKLLATVLPEFRPKPTLYEKWATWLEKTFPLEEEKKSAKKPKQQPKPKAQSKTTNS